MGSNGEPLLAIQGLTIEALGPLGWSTVVDGVSISIAVGEAVALVGESGAGKTMTAMSILRLLSSASTRIVRGSIHFNGVDLTSMTPRQLNRIRGQDIGTVFQDPLASLNPAYTVGEQVCEAVRTHLGVSRRAARERARYLFDRVRIPQPDRRIHEYPHTLSGGMRQRVMIAIALACKPSLLIADEPTTSLDTTVQWEIVNLLTDLKEEMGLSVLLVSHDLALVYECVDRIYVMYAGQVVEASSVNDIFSRPLHPYSELLLQSLPSIDRPASRRPLNNTASVPQAGAFPTGCRFHPRCHYAKPELCTSQEIDLVARREQGSSVRCVRASELCLRGIAREDGANASTS